MKCEVCKQEVEFPFCWDLSRKGLKNLKVCPNCDISLSEQIFMIMEELMASKKKTIKKKTSKAAKISKNKKPTKAKKKFKVVMVPGALKDLEMIPAKERKKFLKELNAVVEKLADGELVGEPIDMQQLATEEPDVFETVVKRHEEFMKTEGLKQNKYQRCIVPGCPEKPIMLKVIAEERPLPNGQIYQIKIDVPMCRTHKSYLDSGHIKFKYNPQTQSITGLNMDELLVSNYGTRKTTNNARR